MHLLFKSNQIKSTQVEPNQIKPNSCCSNRIKPNFGLSNRIKPNKTDLNSDSSQTELNAWSNQTKPNKLQPLNPQPLNPRARGGKERDTARGRGLFSKEKRHGHPRRLWNALPKVTVVNKKFNDQIVPLIFFVLGTSPT